jgi:CheY-like chemotaxis protein
VSQQPHQKEKRILLIEDDFTYRTLILSVLRKSGFNCTFCIDGDHALKKLRQENFDLIITDYLIPGPNGIEIVRWARKQGIDIPMLVVTNYPSEVLSVSIKELGRTKIIAKTSFTVSNMVKIVQEMF